VGRRLGGPRAGLDAVKKRNISSSTNGIDQKCVQNFDLKILKGRAYLEDVSLNGDTVLQWIIKKQGGRFRTRYIWLRIRTKGGSAVDMVMNLRVPYKARNFLSR
jgi:hypothetical protein